MHRRRGIIAPPRFTHIACPSPKEKGEIQSPYTPLLTIGIFIILPSKEKIRMRKAVLGDKPNFAKAAPITPI